ncbi:hypothetical protein M9H77_32627 [Catharanthus roseus]|uniref:Uncharacterized protein n=1 Tax=Catharanthus roseus TaxID=4058 RepID=A0ACC0A4W8_CATRO|nr:hypothetical protein M9H77_32627 [Catharanthus roseus]
MLPLVMQHDYRSQLHFGYVSLNCAQILNISPSILIVMFSYMKLLITVELLLMLELCSRKIAVAAILAFICPLLGKDLVLPKLPSAAAAEMPLMLRFIMEVFKKITLRQDREISLEMMPNSACFKTSLEMQIHVLSQ